MRSLVKKRLEDFTSSIDCEVVHHIQDGRMLSSVSVLWPGLSHQSLDYMSDTTQKVTMPLMCNIPGLCHMAKLAT